MIKKSGRTGRYLKAVLIISGTVFITLCVLAFTTVPFWAYYHLATSNSSVKEPPNVIVMLAGAGIPSENSLIRAYYTSKLARQCPEALVIIAVPGNVNDTMGDPARIASELILRGVSAERITYESKGKNTRSQSLEIARLFSEKQLATAVTVVTSPEHIKRAVLSFRKCGFTNVSGLPAFENSLETDLTFNDHDLKGNKIAPPIGNNLQVRYQFWNHLKYEVIVIREYFALFYYRVRGWI
ncbi:MAG: YdcF family protein [Lentimicrobiaceae bacterium]|nr:YdcF family protein [Lentimicrobiaceae bacterium]MCB9024035.1 YdcF family protein [Lentimicrobiaceae bacterium]MCO5265794.1 YdcF family protein [Lentimicrobium sp.]HPG32615.1 YdcF family protein [Lentimicrobium sp.]